MEKKIKYEIEIFGDMGDVITLFHNDILDVDVEMNTDIDVNFISYNVSLKLNIANVENAVLNSIVEWCKTEDRDNIYKNVKIYEVEKSGRVKIMESDNIYTVSYHEYFDLKYGEQYSYLYLKNRIY